MEFTELDRRRGLLADVLALTSVPRPVSNAVEWHKMPQSRHPFLPSNEPAEPNPPAATWVFYPLEDGKWGIGGFDRGFIQDAVLPTKAAVADWVWNRIASEFVTSRVRPDGWRDDMWFLQHIPLGLLPKIEKWPRPARAHARSQVPFTLWSMLSNPETMTETLAEMGLDLYGPASTELLYLAGNPSTGADLLEVLSRHPHHAIRWSAAGNRSLPQSVVERLVREADFGMRWFLAMAHPISKDVLREWWREDPVLRRPD